MMRTIDVTIQLGPFGPINPIEGTTAETHLIKFSIETDLEEIDEIDGYLSDYIFDRISWTWPCM